MQPADFLVDLLFRDRRNILLDLEAGVIAELGLGHDRDGGLESVRLVVVLDLLEVDLRLVDGLDAGVLDGRLVPAGQGVFESVGVDGFLAVMRDEHRARHLAGTETGHLGVAAQLLDSLVDLRLYLFNRYFDFKLNPVSLEVLLARLDVCHGAPNVVI